jgi:hypothetical protein
MTSFSCSYIGFVRFYDPHSSPIVLSFLRYVLDSLLGLVFLIAK